MHCANPRCQTEAMYFRSGSLHCIDTKAEGAAPRRGEKRQVIWLCRECSARFAVETWRPPGEQLRLRQPVQDRSESHADTVAA